MLRWSLIAPRFLLDFLYLTAQPPLGVAYLLLDAGELVLEALGPVVEPVAPSGGLTVQALVHSPFLAPHSKVRPARCAEGYECQHADQCQICLH